MMPSRTRYEIDPLAIGAEIRGLDLARLDDPGLRQDLYADWLEYGVLIFRGLEVTNAEHIALSRCFGELEIHPIPEIRNAEEPLLMDVGGKGPGRAGKAYVYDGDKLLVSRIAWHRDTAYTVEVSKGSMLRVVESPPEDGETDFCDSALAYEALDEDMRRRIDGLEVKSTLKLDNMDMTLGATWSSIRPATEEECPGSDHRVPLDAASRYPSVVHPLVITHPESGRKCLYISPTYMDAILGMPDNESESLMREIVAHTLSPRFCYRHHWREGDLILWDNRRMLHAASGHAPQYSRRILRTTLAGALKSGRFFDPGQVAAKAALAG
jgi:taurine dioxygenase